MYQLFFHITFRLFLELRLVMTCQGCLIAKNSFGISDIISKISCGQVDMTFVKAA